MKLSESLNALKIMKTFFTIVIVTLTFVTGNTDEIHDAARNGDLQTVTMLLNNDASLLDVKDNKGMTPLHHAIDAGNNNISAYLIKQGADLTIKDRLYGGTPLHYTAAKGSNEIARMIINKYKATLEDRDIQQKTALHIACENGQPVMVKFLLDCGADITVRDHLGLTPLMSSCSGWNMEVVKMLISAGADINDYTLYQNKVYTTLTVAALYGFREMVDFLISMDADISESVMDLTLRYAVQGNNLSLFNYVQDKGLNISGVEKNKFQDLIYTASAAGSKDIFNALVRSGYNPYDKDRYGWTVFHHAASRGKNEMLEFLMEDRDIDVNSRSLRGETAYNVAVFLGIDETVQYLRSIDVDTSRTQFPEIRGPYMGQTPPENTPEMFMPGIVSGPYRAHGTVVFSPDGKEAYWSDMIPGQQCVLEMKMIEDLWITPKRSIMWKDPSISPDGNTLIYISNQPLHDNDPGGKENYWYMDRTESGWTDPKPMDTIINTINIHWHCSMDAPGNLYFSEFENNMYVSEFKNGKYQEPVNLKVFFKNPTLNGHSPFISPSGDYLIFADKDRLYVSYKKEDGTWTDRIDLGDEINSGAGNGSPKVSADGKYLFFQSTTGDKRPWGIYWVSTKIIDKLKQEQLYTY